MSPYRVALLPPTSSGVPVWVATPFAADWRWLRNRDDTPWYPTMRLFRQPVAGDWDTVFERIARELTAETHNRLQRERQARLPAVGISLSS